MHTIIDSAHHFLLSEHRFGLPPTNSEVIGPMGSSVTLGVRKPSGVEIEISLTRGPTNPDNNALLAHLPHLQPISRSPFSFL